MVGSTSEDTTRPIGRSSNVVIARPSAEVLLDEARTEMHVDLNQRFVADAVERVYFAGLDHQHVAAAGLELLSIDRPGSAPRSDELDLVVRMPMRTGPLPRQSVKQEDGHGDVALVGADELVRASDEREVLLA